MRLIPPTCLSPVVTLVYEHLNATHTFPMYFFSSVLSDVPSAALPDLRAEAVSAAEGFE